MVCNALVILLVLLAAIGYVVLSAWITSAGKFWDGIHLHDRNVLKNISRELIRETKMKIRRINDIAEESAVMFAFEIGLIMGKIREKYKTMLEIYRQFKDVYTNKTILWPIGTIDTFVTKFNHYFVGVEHMHVLEMDIDKLVQALEVIPESVWDSNPISVPVYFVNRHPMSKPPYRKHNEEEMFKEETIKRQNRQQYLLRRLGLPTNLSTTQKRFIDKWPVRETWSLERYNYN